MARQLRFTDAPAGANASARTCTISSSTQVGDLLILVWVDSGSDANMDTPPSGWTKLGDTDSTNTNTMGIAVYAKTAVSGDIGATITRTADTIRRHGVAVAGYYDDTGIGLEVESAVFAASLTTPAASTVAANCFVVAGAGVRGGGDDTFGPPSGYVERVDQSTDVGSGGKSWTIADKLATVSAGTSVGGITFTSTDSTQPGSWLVIIKPSLTRVSKTHAASWDVIGRVAKTHAVSWNVSGRVAKTHAVSWDVLSRVSKTHAASWNVLSRVTKTLAASWDVAARVAKTHAASWNVTGRVAKTHAVSWNVGGRASKTHAVSWNVLSRVTKTHLVRWDVTGRVTKTFSATWNVLARVNKTHAASWNVAANPSATVEAYVSDGVTWKRAEIKISNGTTWVDGDGKVSNGASWH